MSLSSLKKVILNDEFIRKDSFIAPAIIRKCIKTIHFHCLQTDTPLGFDATFLSENYTKQIIHSSIKKLVCSIKEKEIVLDLDLDLFYTPIHLGGSVWNKEDIINYIDIIKPLIKKAKIITIAMSHHFSGTPEETLYLTKLITPKNVKI